TVIENDFFELSSFFKKLKPINSKFNQLHETTTKKDKASLYIHIPFCRHLCPYCSFNRFHYDEKRAGDYFKNLKKEIEYLVHQNFTFDHIYFGGGTPTVNIEELLNLLDFLHDNFNIRQISLETNPTDIDPDNLKGLAGLKVKRLSVGVQSFDDRILDSIGRRYLSGDEVKERLMEAKGIFDTLNIDLIFNLPNQSLGVFKRDITVFKRLGIDQVTFYPLMPSLRRKTALEKKFNKINTTREKFFYQMILDEVFRDGYSASTPWCFSKGEKIIDEYIVEYNDFIGIGSGAISYLERMFYVNSFSLKRYNKLVEKDKLPVVLWSSLSSREAAQYYMLTKLFGMGLSRKNFYKRFAKDINRILLTEVFLFKRLGIVREHKGKFSVPESGMYHVSTLMKEFFTALNNLREYCMKYSL
ncbi:MAG: coproporphyrinogen III oxidase family protein, partial [Candidatus Hodarchaeota archaeon]